MYSRPSGSQTLHHNNRATLFSIESSLEGHMTASRTKDSLGTLSSVEATVRRKPWRSVREEKSKKEQSLHRKRVVVVSRLAG